jgi:uncharacterized protein
MTTTLTQVQLDMIKRQIGREPRGLVGIAHQTSDGIPTVLQIRSLVDNRPFPTLFWLCSKDLYRAIAEIETSGWVKQIEQEIQQDETLREAFRSSSWDLPICLSSTVLAEFPSGTRYAACTCSTPTICVATT